MVFFIIKSSILISNYYNNFSVTTINDAIKVKVKADLINIYYLLFIKTAIKSKNKDITNIIKLIIYNNFILFLYKKKRTERAKPL